MTNDEWVKLRDGAVKSYPELRTVAEMVASMTAAAISVAVSHTESEMPYKAQFVLEETIKLLQAKV